MATPKSESKNQELNESQVLFRLLEIGGELSGNTLRILAIAIFYVIELLNFHGLQWGFIEFPRDSSLSPEFHRTMLVLAAVWILLCLGLWGLNRQRIYNSAIKYVASGLDALLCTFLLLMADGPKSPLVVVYLLIIVVAMLRFSRPLIYFVTLASTLGYLSVTLDATWHHPERLVPHYAMLIFVVALALTGTILGQVLRSCQQTLSLGLNEEPTAKEGA